MLLFEFIVFLTAVFYGVRGVKATKILTQVRENFGPKPMMGMLLRDSIFYFLMYVTLALSPIKMSGNLKNCLAFSAASQSWHWRCAAIIYYLCRLLVLTTAQDKSTMGLSFMSITITRMLLRLRKRAKPDLDPTISQDMELATFRVAIPAEQVSIDSGA